MSRSAHATYTAADRYERRPVRRKTRQGRRRQRVAAILASRVEA